MPRNIQVSGARGKAPFCHDVSPSLRWITPPRGSRLCRAAAGLLGSTLLALSGCISAPIGTNGRWVGPLTPVAGTCDPAATAVLLVSPKSATFSPDNGILLLRGHADAPNHVTADLRTTGMNHQPYVVSFEGTLQGGRITGTYLTPRCRSSVTLSRG